jgi:hypothetical protein
VGHKVEFDLYYGATPDRQLQIMHKVFSDAVSSLYVVQCLTFYFLHIFSLL